MKPIKLKNQPKNLPPTTEVRDFDLGGGKYARVIMELSKVLVDGLNTQGERIEHWAITAQCYEMTKDGQFKMAPNGYPSRSNTTTHTTPGSALGTTMEIDDAWVRVSMDFDPLNPPEGAKMSATDPKGEAEYGAIHQNTKTATTWRYAQGWADIIAQTKVEDLQRVLASSTVRSGLGFRKQQ